MSAPLVDHHDKIPFPKYYNYKATLTAIICQDAVVDAVDAAEPSHPLATVRVECSYSSHVHPFVHLYHQRLVDKACLRGERVGIGVVEDHLVVAFLEQPLHQIDQPLIVGIIGVMTDADVTVVEFGRERMAVYQQAVRCQLASHGIQMLLALKV